MTITVPEWTGQVADEQPYPLVFATVSGAHLYGFASVDSDVDLRGAHLLPAAELVGLRHGPETVNHIGDRHGVELDLVTHDLAKCCRLLLGRSGDVLEQVTSPLTVRSTPLHEELLALVPGCLTAGYADHYLGFSVSSEKLFARTGELKPALYLLRVLATGLHLMRTGQVLADLTLLHEDAKLPYVPDLIAAKRQGEHRRLGVDAGLPGPDRILADTARLRAELADAKAATGLPRSRPPPTPCTIWSCGPACTPDRHRRASCSGLPRPPREAADRRQAGRSAGPARPPRETVNRGRPGRSAGPARPPRAAGRQAGPQVSAGASCGRAPPWRSRPGAARRTADRR